MTRVSRRVSPSASEAGKRRNNNRGTVSARRMKGVGADRKKRVSPVEEQMVAKEERKVEERTRGSVADESRPGPFSALNRPINEQLARYSREERLDESRGGFTENNIPKSILLNYTKPYTRTPYTPYTSDPHIHARNRDEHIQYVLASSRRDHCFFAMCRYRVVRSRRASCRRINKKRLK